MSDALDRDDTQQVYEQAHRLHGLAALCGFEQLRQAASDLEAAAKLAQPLGAPGTDVLAAIDRVYRRLTSPG